MKNKILFIGTLVIGFLLTGCSSPSTQDTIEHLNGYWSIHKVKKQDGKTRQYKVNPMIDYIEIDSTGYGYRIKVEPKIDGSYRTTGDVEHFNIDKENDSIHFHYKTEMDNWTETLLSIKKDRFTVKNSRGITYTYKRFESLKKELEAHEHGKKQ